MKKRIFQWAMTMAIGAMFCPVVYGAEGGLRDIYINKKVFSVNLQGSEEKNEGLRGIRKKEKITVLFEYFIEDSTNFIMREMTRLADLCCQWQEKDVFVLEDAHDKSQLPQVPQNMDKILMQYIGRTSGEGIVETNDIAYIHGSKDYFSLEKYIQENFDSSFSISDYTIEENPPIDTTTMDISNKEGGANATLPINTLEIRLQVKGYPAFYGYRVKVFSGYVKYIEPVGEWNEHFDLSKIEVLDFTDEELKEMAVKKDGFGGKYQVQEVRIHRYFDVKDLKAKADVETVYRKLGGQFFVTTQTF